MGVASLAAGCYTPDELRDRADRDALALVDLRRRQLFGAEGPFALPAATAAFGRGERDPSTWTAREQVLAGMIDILGPIDVLGALEIAAEDNQDVQEERESLYIAALDLTQDRWTFGYRYQADGGGSVGGDVGGVSASAGADFGASVTRILGSGAVILANIGADLFRFVSTGDGWDTISSLGLSVTQPLLRGTGRLVTMEPLRQSERDLIYSVRDFERFRRTFAVDVSERVYRVLQSRDQLNNERLNFENLEQLRVRNEALAEAGQLSEIQADQARQNLLSSKTRLVQLQGTVERQLDTFKVFLGLPVEGVDVTFADGILQSLASDDSFLDGLTEGLAVEFAIENRLDIMTSFDRVQDAV
ncbi:MAG: TolC family protein, partial [Planctomycetota bacterium]